MRLPQMTTRRRMIAVGIMLLGPTSAAAFETSRSLRFIPPQVKVEVDADGIPPDLRIEAHYEADYSRPRSRTRSWKVTIAGDGKAVQAFADRGGNTKRELSLTRRDLQDLLNKAREADFFALPENTGPRVLHAPTLILKITANKKTHRVSVSEPSPRKDEESINRFMDVWSEVLRKVPPPNPDQKPK